MTFLTDEVKRMVGTLGPVRVAAEAIDASMLRRFAQGVMEEGPEFRDPAASEARFGPGGLAAPPLFVDHAFRLPIDAPDPVDELADDPDWDGGGEEESGLPELDLPLKRILNGGTKARFFELARIGERISAQAEYASISERSGKSGPMVMVDVKTTYRSERGALLAEVTNTLIRR